MMKKIILPSDSHSHLIQKSTVGDDLVLGTTVGLVKKSNEDALGGLIEKDTIRICIIDGHWGDEAARIIRDYWLDAGLIFPRSVEAAARATERVEEELFLKFGKENMDENRDLTPEAAFVTAERIRNTMRIVSYGDCRLLVIRNRHVIYELKTQETWLGAFSRLGLRQRLAVKKAVIFDKLPILKDDLIIMFSDGVDQCVYGRPTISKDRVIELAGSCKNPSELFDALIGEVFLNGAEDNASLVVIRVS